MRRLARLTYTLAAAASLVLALAAVIAWVHSYFRLDRAAVNAARVELSLYSLDGRASLWVQRGVDRSQDADLYGLHSDGPGTLRVRLSRRLERTWAVDVKPWQFVVADVPYPAIVAATLLMPAVVAGRWWSRRRRRPRQARGFPLAEA